MENQLDSYRAIQGLRMPADRGGAGGAEGRHPKAARGGTRGPGRAYGVYGDLRVADGREGQGRGQRATAWLAERSRPAWGSLRPRVCTLANVARSTVQVRESTG
jgi:hypothetical protein